MKKESTKRGLWSGARGPKEKIVQRRRGAGDRGRVLRICSSGVDCGLEEVSTMHRGW